MKRRVLAWIDRRHRIPSWAVLWMPELHWCGELDGALEEKRPGHWCECLAHERWWVRRLALWIWRPKPPKDPPPFTYEEQNEMMRQHIEAHRRLVERRDET